MNFIFFQILVPPLIVGGIAGLSLSILGIGQSFDRIKERYELALMARNTAPGQDPRSPDNAAISRNPIDTALLQDAPGEYLASLYFWKVLLVSLYAFSEIAVFISILSALASAWDPGRATDCPSLSCLPDVSLYALLAGYLLLSGAVILTAFLYIVIPKDLGEENVESVDTRYEECLMTGPVS